MMATLTVVEDIQRPISKRSSCPGIAVRRTASLPLAYDPGIHVFLAVTFVDGRVKPGHDGGDRGAIRANDLKLHTRPRRGLADIFVGLLKRVFQRLGRRHVADLGEMRRDGLWRPFALRKVDAFGLHDLDHSEGTGARG